ncbi:MAG: dihydroorotate dehydrogenase electron transfer subunit [Oscillospiraceae bacterium]|nr:dihydroorotate dehydrogenase electron transfer subunit [Oscillospiraceae bacterium]
MQRFCEIITSRELAPDIFAITIEAGALGELAKPGQFLHIKCGDGVLLRRPISICDCRDGYLKLVFRVVGPGTQWLAEQKRGALDVLGPLGTGFSVEGRHILLVGGGIGVPPLLYAARAATGLTTAILGFSTADQVILTEQFRDVCKGVILTTDDGTAGEHCFATSPLEQKLQSGNYDAILACGPNPMLKAVAELADRYNVPCQVSMEERMACGVGACLGCTVTMTDGRNLRACHEGPVFNAKEVQWNG